MFNMSLPATISLTSGQIFILHNMSIVGPGANLLTISGSHLSRVFSIPPFGIQAVDISDLTIADGTDPDDLGGGGISNVANHLSVSNCAFTGNSTAGVGAGIANFGTLLVTNCTFTNNSAGTNGGAIFNEDTLSVTNSTFSGNSAGLGGGGIETEFSFQPVAVINCTFNLNAATGSGGGGILVNTLVTTTLSSLDLRNTIIAGSTGGDCVLNNGAIIGTNSHNLIQDGSCSPMLSGDPKLGPLQFNGGPTQTFALLGMSPAIDKGDDSVLADPMFPATDQRGPGFPRKFCAHVDIGAFEASAPPAVACPANISAATDPGKSSAQLSFSATATDICDGPITPVCKIGATVITSPYAFPVGLTTVTCSATDVAGLTGTCSFTVTVTPFDTCLKDNSTGNLLQWNGTTGAYKFTRCSDNFMLTGTGTVALVNGIRTLTDFKTDRRISAGFNTGHLTGNATIYLKVAQGVWQVFQIYDTKPSAVCKC
jgi:predicted outer membrane repeat protein